MNFCPARSVTSKRQPFVSKIRTAWHLRGDSPFLWSLPASEHRPEPFKLFPASVNTSYCERVITGLDAALNSQTIWCTYTQGRQIILNPPSKKCCQSVDAKTTVQWPPKPSATTLFCFLIIQRSCSTALMMMMERRLPPTDHNAFHSSNNIMPIKRWPK